MKIKHYRSVRVEVTEYLELFEVKVYSGYFNVELIGNFWLPIKAKDNLGWVDPKLVKARMLHDYKIEYEHYSYCSKLCTDHPRLIPRNNK